MKLQLIDADLAPTDRRYDVNVLSRDGGPEIDVFDLRRDGTGAVDLDALMAETTLYVPKITPTLRFIMDRRIFDELKRQFTEPPPDKIQIRAADLARMPEDIRAIFEKATENPPINIDLKRQQLQRMARGLAALQSDPPTFRDIPITIVES